MIFEAHALPKCDIYIGQHSYCNSTFMGPHEAEDLARGIPLSSNAWEREQLLLREPRNFLNIRKTTIK
jgi:hypothetical protein